VICFRCVEDRTRLWEKWRERGPWVYDRSHLELTPGDFLIHLAVHSDIHIALVTLGFLDAEEDGGILFWRWDPWNAKMATALREFRRLERAGVKNRAFPTREGPAPHSRIL
jgi:hypothetical protein